MKNQAASEAMFDALGDPMRRRIVERLRRGSMPVGELAAGLPVGRPAVSKHLKVLEGAGLVEHRGVGTRNLYALAPQGFVALQQWLDPKGHPDEPPADSPPGRRRGPRRGRV